MELAHTGGCTPKTKAPQKPRGEKKHNAKGRTCQDACLLVYL